VSATSTITVLTGDAQREFTATVLDVDSAGVLHIYGSEGRIAAFAPGAWDSAHHVGAVVKGGQ
jgi:hypothetical protein